MLLTQTQASTAALKNELNQSKQEQQHLVEMLRKRKEEAEILHQNLEEARKEQQNKKVNQEDSRSKWCGYSRIDVAAVRPAVEYWESTEGKPAAIAEDEQHAEWTEPETEGANW